jgi:metal-sulfur cluster biosynthetic enzyme
MDNNDIGAATSTSRPAASPAHDASAPSAAAADTPALTEERVREALRNVVDPEIGIDMVSLGLIYDIAIQGSVVHVTMTLTSPGCPVAGMFINAVHAALLSIPGVTDAKVDLTFSPPWDPRTMASEDAKMMMGLYY